MADFVLNKIEFHGDEDSINKLKGRINEIIRNNSKQIMGDLLEENSNDVDWYEHNKETYGTKWDISVENCVNIRIYDDNAILEFETAWAPPIDFLKNTCIKYNVSGTLKMDGNFFLDDGIAKSDSSGNVEWKTYKYHSEKYNDDPEWFFTDIMSDYIHGYPKNWDEVVNMLDYVTVEHIEEIKNLFEAKIPFLDGNYLNANEEIRYENEKDDFFDKLHYSLKKYSKGDWAEVEKRYWFVSELDIAKVKELFDEVACDSKGGIKYE